MSFFVECVCTGYTAVALRNLKAPDLFKLGLALKTSALHVCHSRRLKLSGELLLQLHYDL